MPTLDTSLGRLRGADERGLRIFRGIPYAVPPVGALRFRPPQPPASWGGVRDATAFGPTCPQPPDLVSSLLGFETQPASEDCLTLNVWTPGPDAARRPVLVWIHGGAFTVGSGSRAMTDGAGLARRGDAVVVSLNYRLGAFGFLYLGQHGGERFAADANLGLLDQIAALEWVRREIGAFGGDPDNVTVFGESAGSISVAMLLAMPAARGLFRRAILQSGAANFAAVPERAALVTDAVLRELGLAAADAGRLRDLPAERLLEAQARLLMAPPKGVAGLPFQPVIDGHVLPSHPDALLAAGSARGIDTLIGSTADEMKLFDVMDPRARALDDAALLRRCTRTIGDETRARHAIELYRDARAARGAAIDPPSLWSAIESDRLFRAPAMRLAARQAALGTPSYAYLFTWTSPYLDGGLGACHALDVPFAFGTHADPRIAPFAGSGPNADRLAARVQDAWLAFARSGDPRHAYLSDWPPYVPPRRATMLLGRECGVVDAPYDAERAVWDHP